MKKFLITLITLFFIIGVNFPQFKPVWTGNGYNQMNIYVYAVDSIKYGDTIAVFDGNICVGAAQVTNIQISQMSPLIIIASADDPTTTTLTDGFIQGHKISFGIKSEGKVYNDNEIIKQYSAGSEFFVENGSASVALTIQKMVMPPNEIILNSININTGTNLNFTLDVSKIFPNLTINNISVDQKPTWITYKIENPNVTFTGLSSANESNDTIKIKVTLAIPSIGTKDVIIKIPVIVRKANDAPFFITTSLNDATIGNPYSAQIEFGDNNSSSISVKLISAPQWISMQGGPNVTLSNKKGSISLVGTPPITAAKISQVILEISDETYTRSMSYILNVKKANNPPIAKPINLKIKEDKSAIITLLGFDYETPDSIYFTLNTLNTLGTVELTSTNVCTFYPKPDFNGIDSFKYTVKDAGGLSATAKVTITILPVNDPPELTIQARKLQMNMNDTLSIIVDANDDKDGANKSPVEIVNEFGPFNGKLIKVSDGFYKYVPNKGYFGKELISLYAIELSPDSLRSNRLLIEINVKRMNTPPIAIPREVVIFEDKARDFRLLAIDNEDNIKDLIFEIVDAPKHSISYTLSENRFTYIPEADYCDRDSFTFRVKDSQGAYSDIAKVNIKFIPENDRPKVRFDSVSTGGLTTKTIDFNNYITDPDNNESDLTIEFLLNNAGQAMGLLGGTLTKVNGNTYTYNKGLNPYKVDFIVYQVKDTNDKSEPQTLIINGMPGISFNWKAGNDSAVAINDSSEVSFGQQKELIFVGLDLVPPFDSLKFDVLPCDTCLKYGQLLEFKALKASHTSNTPATSYSGLYAPTANSTSVLYDKIKFKVTDQSGHSDTAFVIIAINPGKAAPEIADIPDKTINEGNSLSFLINYSDLDSKVSDLQWSVSASPNISGMSLSITDKDTLAVRFNMVPPVDYFGNVLVSIVCRDEADLTDSVEFTVKIENVNDAPILSAISNKTTVQNTPLTIQMFGEDIDGDSLTYTAISKYNNVTLNVIDNELTITPKESYIGTDSITVTVSDNGSPVLTDSKSFKVEIITGDNIPFVNSVEDKNINEDEILTLQISPIDLNSNDTIQLMVSSSNQILIPDTSISVDIVRAKSNVKRTLQFIPLAESSGSTKITLMVQDNNLNSSIQQFFINVKEVNDKPVLLNPGSISMFEDSSKTITLSAIDNDSYTLIYSGKSLNNNIELSLEGNMLKIISKNNYFGTANIRVYVTDGNSTDSLTLPVNILNVPDKPVITSSPLTSVNEDSQYSYVLNITDADNVTSFKITYTIPSWMTFNSTTRTFTGTPTNDNVGSHNVSITVIDETNHDTTTQSFVITVINTNDAPVFSSTALTTATVGVKYTYNISATDVDQGASLTITAPTKPAWLTFTASGNTAVLTGTPTTAGNYNVVLQVTDGIISTPVQQSFTIVVSSGSGVTEQNINMYLNISPNPSDGEYNLLLSGLLQDEIHIIVYNLQGQTVYNNLIIKNSELLNTKIDLRGNSSGLYNLQLINKDVVINTKLMIK
jgi:hypothetical protein